MIEKICFCVFVGISIYFQPGAPPGVNYSGSDSPTKINMVDEINIQPQLMTRSQMTQSHSSGGLKSRLMNVLGLSPGNEGASGTQ